MLSVDDVKQDYEAVIESRELLHSMFGSSWPREGFTLTENLTDLEQHQQEFLNREAFAYTIVSLDESRVLGCIYINPARKVDINAEVYMWVRQSEYDQGLDPILFQKVKMDELILAICSCRLPRKGMIVSVVSNRRCIRRSASDLNVRMQLRAN
jgi:hypothetical protein